MRPGNNSFDLARLRSSLRPFRLHWFPTLRSTNDHAAVLRRRGTLYAPALVLTGRQTAGRGRGLHSWWSAGGCLTGTFVLPIDDAIQPHQLPLLAGLAVRRAAEAALQAALSAAPGDVPGMAKLPAATATQKAVTRIPDIQLKWPNDLVCEGRKLGGLLCTRVDRADLVGLGLNVNLDPADAPPDLRARITSLSQLASRPFDLTQVLADVARSLFAVMQQTANVPFAEFLKEYDAHHALIGRRVSVQDGSNVPPVRGRCEGLDSMGRLLLRDGNRLHHVITGQTSLQ